MKRIATILALLFIQSTFAMGPEFEDNLADVMTWIILILLPIGGVYLFWKAHIYPEIVAEKNHHPQLEAIKVMCLLSLFVGGLLWPFALIWANYNYKKSATISITDENKLLLENQEKIEVESNLENK